MRRMHRLMFLILFMALTAPAHAGGIYIGTSGGVTNRPDTTLTSPSLGSVRIVFDSGFALGGFLGYDFDSPLRLESEITYRENVIRTGGGIAPQAGTSALMFNGFYDFSPFKNSFEIYFGGGIGSAIAQLTTISLGQSIDESERVFAYQLEVGFGWNFRSNFNFNLGYRFFDTAEPEFVLSTGPRLRMDLENHEVIMKLRYRFDL